MIGNLLSYQRIIMNFVLFPSSRLGDCNKTVKCWWIGDKILLTIKKWVLLNWIKYGADGDHPES